MANHFIDIVVFFNKTRAKVQGIDTSVKKVLAGKLKMRRQNFSGERETRLLKDMPALIER
jgi:hypothetical protein